MVVSGGRTWFDTIFVSKKAFKMLQGSPDTKADQCVLSRVKSKPIPLQTSPTGLYLIDMLDICQKDATAFNHEETKTRLSDRSQPQFGLTVLLGIYQSLGK